MVGKVIAPRPVPILTGLGALYGGATVAAWYPITPSTSVVDAYEKYAKRVRIDPGTGRRNYAIVQGEDELAAIGMAIGASWNYLILGFYLCCIVKIPI